MARLPHLLDGLPSLTRLSPFSIHRSCKLCGSHAIPFDQVDFNKFVDDDDYYRFGMSGVDITYLRCLCCDFIFTEDFDDWSADDFRRFIYNTDYILVDSEYASVRPEQMARDFAYRFRGCENARILDYGSGAGVFVDRMREHGFGHIEGYDPFSSPGRPSGEFDIVTCFEVIEHSTDPVRTLGDMRNLMRSDGCIILSQTLHPTDILSRRGSWSYLAPRNGHVSTYNEEALIRLGRRHGLALHRGNNIFGFASATPSSFASVALQSAGRPFGILRLLAPREVGSRAILSPTPDVILWHATESDGIWGFRWTGTSDISWEARWEGVSTLQVRIPILSEVEPGFALLCSLELNWQRTAVCIDRGELMAEFDVSGFTTGQITLRMPCTHGLESDSVLPRGSRGLAVLVSRAPCLDEGLGSPVEFSRADKPVGR